MSEMSRQGQEVPEVPAHLEMASPRTAKRALGCWLLPACGWGMPQAEVGP